MRKGKAPAQSTISSFFQSPERGSASRKRSNSPIDLTVDSDDGAPPHKRPRTQTPRASLAESPARSSSNTTKFAEDWNFSLTPKAPKARTVAENKRHEAFKKKLLSDNSRFLKEAAEDSAPTTQAIEQDDVDMTDRQQTVEDSDRRFEKLSEMFSNKAEGKRQARAKASATRAKKVAEIGPSGEPYTPLELQVRDLKKSNAGTVLMVEVGYKYKFFGKDAQIASKELGMVSYTDRNFLVASIPTHRRDVHLKKLLAQGYRVGIVEQIETAALKKVSDNRNTPFERKLTHLLTSATYVDDLESVDDLEKYTTPPFMCLTEEPQQNKAGDVSIGLISICPSTGDVVWDDFEDTPMRIELETRLVHIRPTELLVARHSLSPETGKMLSHFTGITSYGHRTRTEQLGTVMDYSEAFSKVSDFYTDKNKFGAASESFKSGKLMASVTDFPKRVIIALAHTIQHLAAFGIADAFLETQFFTKFTTRAHMLLTANTLTNLEVYRNDTDYTTKGSLMWILDRTKTRFGARLLRSWVGRPLVDKRLLQDRIDAVEEILESSSELLLTLRGVLKGLPDLAKGLCRIQYGQCTPQELAQLLPAFDKVANAYSDAVTLASVGLKSSVLNEIIASLPRLKDPMKELLRIVKVKDAKDGKKDSMWRDPERYPDIIDADMSIRVIEVELQDELKAIRKQLRYPSLEWRTVANDECLVEVKRSENRPIPDNWILHSKTTHYARYQPPSVRAKLEERAQHRETLLAAANKAYKSFLKEIAINYYGILRDAVNKLAAADCLISLAQVALQEGYVRPEFTDDDSLEIVDGRHPMIEALRSDPYVPNSIQMGGNAAGSKIVTGPNMGGKSSCVRVIALVALMAQIGSYVPAASLKMGLLDSILTRMGASDDLARGRSTFMVEMAETNEIIRSATKRSLVILDELGRGTSTFDGMAIAEATLQHLVEKVHCKTLFITHFPLVATKLAARFPMDIENLHMAYETESRIDGKRDVIFLYQLISGITSESFGIECGRLANLPEHILSVAAERSSHFQEEVKMRVRRNRIQKAAHLIQQCLGSTGIVAEAALEDLKTMAESLRLAGSI